jgi:hypothetical protein
MAPNPLPPFAPVPQLNGFGEPVTGEQVGEISVLLTKFKAIEEMDGWYQTFMFSDTGLMSAPLQSR